jgi:diguanylate cyclase (GGDEF)-like protein
VKRSQQANRAKTVMLSLFRPPQGLLNQTRWLFSGMTVLALLAVLPQVLASASDVGGALAVLAAAALLTSWVYRYLTATESAPWDAGEAVATGLSLAASPAPEIVLSYAFAALWLRAVCGNLKGFIRYVAFVLTALAVGEVTWSWLPGHGHDQSWAAVKSFPVFLVVAGVARFLAVNLLARERTQSRDLTLAELGARLLSAESQGRIAVAGVWAATRICAATPGLCTAWLAEAEAGLTVLRQVGTPFALPAQLPWPDRHCGRQGSPPPADTIERLADVLATGAGLNGAWRLVPLAGQSGNWILLGAQDRLPAEAVVAVESMTHQLGLALRNVQARQRLAADATTDALTGLANRAAFEQAVTSALASGAPAAVLYLDLDGFKAINDQWGHAAGDDVLRHVGDRLRQSVRPTDVCARLGGDEFAVLMAGLSPRSATEMANRLSATLSGPMIVAGRPIEVGASIGVAVGDRGPAHLIEAADQAMYAAKRLRAAALAP